MSRAARSLVSGGLVAIAQQADAAGIAMITLDPAPLFQFIQVADDAGVGLESSGSGDLVQRGRKAVLADVAADEVEDAAAAVVAIFHVVSAFRLFSRMGWRAAASLIAV